MIDDGECKYLIVDGGSSDNTLKFCSENSIKAFYLPKGNMYKAINFGLKKLLITSALILNSFPILIKISLSPISKPSIKYD